ncbi:hypothetical protein K431DRAFT_52452 [Polychaeton citri CBS 116435]|uniref:Uncharacterized protein n=1 Tax=Polychaeton citri CBS 116435 TaxID=1314669 RepID=A0A9P4UV34_9PEZI|nr:hypothetical protein K431DRAFT_52452 [Polychaeton citri CBS 116435]
MGRGCGATPKQSWWWMRPPPLPRRWYPSLCTRHTAIVRFELTDRCHIREVPSSQGVMFSSFALVIVHCDRQKRSELPEALLARFAAIVMVVVLECSTGVWHTCPKPPRCRSST